MWNSVRITHQMSVHNRAYIFDNINNLDEALTLFHRMLQTKPTPQISDYNKLLNVVVRMNHHLPVITMFKKLTLLGCPVSNYTMNIAINCYCRIKELDLGFAMVGCFLKRGYAPDVVTYTTLINGVCGFKRWAEADRLLRLMVADRIYPNIRTFTGLVNSYCKEGLLRNAEDVVQVMTGIGMHPDVITYNALMDGYCSQGQPDKAKGVLNVMAEKGLDPDLVSYRTLVNGYCKHKKVDEAWEVFKEMGLKGFKPNAIMYNSMIQRLFSVGRCGHALELFDEMKLVGLVVDNVYTYGIVLDGLLDNGKFQDAMMFYHEVDNKGLAGHVSFYTIFIRGLCSNNQIDLALSIFNNLSSKGLYPDVITYTVMMKGLCQEGMFKEVKELLEKMEKSGCIPDSVTYNTIIQGCLEHDDSLDILRQIVEKDFSLDASTFSMLLQQMQDSDEDLGRKSLIQKLISNYTRSLMA